jgi:CRISPR-associated protein Cmr1
MSYRQLHFTLRFLTPAFLGDAEQNGRWRTPPIKALLRQWWRVLNWSKAQQDWRSMREAEGRLFGNAWLEKDCRPAHCKSPVRMRLDPSWARGTLSTQRWPKDFDSVQTTRSGGSVPADLYLGYGPIQRSRGNTTMRTAIEPEATAKLRLLPPHEHSQEIAAALALIQWFGAIGSRSRNGWGSIWLDAKGETPPLPPLRRSERLLDAVSRNWSDCHTLDWPHAIGSDDDGPLIWCTEEFGNWRQAIGALANVRLAVRRAAKTIRNPGGCAAALHYLGYPAGTGTQNPWKLEVADKRDTLRLASPLRFKVAPAGGGVRGIVFHVPCAVPAAFLDQVRNHSDRAWLANAANLRNAWQRIHETLDSNPSLRRLGD